MHPVGQERPLCLLSFLMVVTALRFLPLVTVGGRCRAVLPCTRVSPSLILRTRKGPQSTGLSEENNQGQKIESHRGVKMQISH